MKKIIVFLALVLLIACVPEYVPQENIVEKIRPEPEKIVEQIPERVIPAPFTKVYQTNNAGRVLWGYNQAGDLILLNSSDKTVVFSYSDGNLAVIDDGIMPVRLFYNPKNQLISVEKGIKRWIFTYNSLGNLVMMEDSEKLHVSHDSKDRLSRVARDSGTSTEFEYDDYNRTKTMFRFNTQTQMRYDTEDRLTLLVRQDDHLVLGYWRYDLLSSLSGTMYGLKETVNYGPQSITLVSNVDQNEFTSQYAEDEDARMNAFNTFLFCKRFRKIPVLFDGQSWVLYHEYYKGNITDYLLKGFVCDALP